MYFFSYPAAFPSLSLSFLWPFQETKPTYKQDHPIKYFPTLKATTGNQKTMPDLASWTREEDKAFENAIAVNLISDFDEKQWDKIASMVPNKTMEEIKQHYQFLVEDVGAIEAGNVPLPNYGNEETTNEQRENSNQGNGHSGYGHSSMGNGAKGGSKLDQERKKGIPWTEEEHRLFLLGLDRFGKGDWRSISRSFVITRTPTQVASHAQKYFIRLNSMNRDRRRSSIHDITSVNNGGLSQNQASITGQQNSNTASTVAVAVAAKNKHRAQPSVAPSLGMYGAQMGHPVTATPPPPHMASAIGTPVILPPAHHPHHYHPPHYVVPVAYPVAPPPMHR